MPNKITSRKILSTIGQGQEHNPKGCAFFGFLAISRILARTLFFLLLFSSVAYASELKASWYSIQSLKKEGTYAYSKGKMANGEKFKDETFTCATRLYPLGTTLNITNRDNGRSVQVKVTDRIGRRFATSRIDLSRMAFLRIGKLEEGIIPIKVERLE